MGKRQSAFDVLGAVFYFAKSFPFSAQKIHTAFFGLKREHPNLLRDFTFDMDRPFPYCEKINLGILGMLGSEHLYWEINREGSIYKADDRMSQHFESRVKDKFIPEELRELEEIARKLAS